MKLKDMTISMSDYLATAVMLLLMIVALIIMLMNANDPVEYNPIPAPQEIVEGHCFTRK